MSNLLVGMDSVDRLIAIIVVSLFCTILIVSISGAIKEVRLARYNVQKATELEGGYVTAEHMHEYVSDQIAVSEATLQQRLDGHVHATRNSTERV